MAASATRPDARSPSTVPDSEFEIPLDTLILAISQHSVLDFFGDHVPELTPAGYIDVDPFTFETSISGVYAGGDVAGDGPSSIVKAAAEGKAVAQAIVDRPGAGRDRRAASRHPSPSTWPRWCSGAPAASTASPSSSRPSMPVTASSRRCWGISAEQAMAEAERCLDCHHICSLCVGVCPNMALLTYESEPFTAALPALRVEHGQVVPGESAGLSGASRPCRSRCSPTSATSAATASRPAPRPGSRTGTSRGCTSTVREFEAEADNAFMLFDDGSVEGRYGGETHRLSAEDTVEYASPRLRARLAAGSLALLEAVPVGSAADGQDVSLRPAADMYVLLRGAAGSMQPLPRAPREKSIETRIEHPGYDA